MNQMQGKVSIIMPSYRQSWWLPRAFRSLRMQSIQDWECVFVDDGDDSGASEIYEKFADDRFRYLRSDHNVGLGEALNIGVRESTGSVIAFLPSDDLWDRLHLESLLGVISESCNEDVLAYAGVRWKNWTADAFYAKAVASPGLQPEFVPVQEIDYLRLPPDSTSYRDVRSGNPLALVQVGMRRATALKAPWLARSERVSDRIELEYWQALAQSGVEFRYTGAVTCEWGNHPEQHHKIITGRGQHVMTDPLSHKYGLSAYRQHYNVDAAQSLDWQPSAGISVNESVRYEVEATPRERIGLSGSGDPRQRLGATGRVRTGAERPRILIVGSLGFNPDRMRALTEAGAELATLWMPRPALWDYASASPAFTARDIRWDADWRTQVQEFQPDVVYMLLNWHAIPTFTKFAESGLDFPTVIHFKESPVSAMARGMWPSLSSLIQNAAGLVCATEEARRWFEVNLPALPEKTTVIDGDPPLARWMGGVEENRLSDRSGQIHTVCAGRILMAPALELADAGIHVHLYGTSQIRWAPEWVEAAERSSYVHLHATVEPSDWSRELSQYDAGWMHNIRSSNDEDPSRIAWEDMNMPARIGTYAAAGIPFIHNRTDGHANAVSRVGRETGAGIAYGSIWDLKSQLESELETRSSASAMRRSRLEFSFDAHVDHLLDFLLSCSR